MQSEGRLGVNPFKSKVNSEQRQVYDLGDGYLAFESRGVGVPLILVHGFSFDMRTWDAQMEILS